MSNEINFKNFLHFIKSNLKKIIIPSIVIAFIFLAGSIFSLMYVEDEPQDSQEEFSEAEIEMFQSMPFEELTPKQQENYLDYLSEDAYYFSLYVEHEDSDAFTAPYLLEEILLQAEVIGFVEDAAGVEFNIDPEVALTVTKGESNVIHEIQVGTGNRVNNLKLTAAYMEALEEEITPFLENKRFYIISDQVLLREREIPEDSVEQGEESQGNDVFYVIIMTLIGMFLGFILGIVFALGRLPWSKKSHELYEFVQDSSDIYIDLDDDVKQNVEQKNKRLMHAILYPTSNKKVILNDYTTTGLIIGSLLNENDLENMEVQLRNDVTELDPAIKYDEVVILVIRNKTTKQWYENQRMQLRNYSALIKIIEC